MRSEAPALMPILRSQHQAELLTLLLLHPGTEYSITELSENGSEPGQSQPCGHSVPTQPPAWAAVRLAHDRTLTAGTSKPRRSVVPDVTRIGIDHGEEHADVLPVLLHRPIRCPA